MFTAIYALAGIGLIASIMLGAIEKGMKQAEEMAEMEQKDKVAAVGASINVWHQPDAQPPQSTSTNNHTSLLIIQT